MFLSTFLRQGLMFPKWDSTLCRVTNALELLSSQFYLLSAVIKEKHHLSWLIIPNYNFLVVFFQYKIKLWLYFRSSLCRNKNISWKKICPEVKETNVFPWFITMCASRSAKHVPRTLWLCSRVTKANPWYRWQELSIALMQTSSHVMSFILGAITVAESIVQNIDFIIITKIFLKNGDPKGAVKLTKVSAYIQTNSL